MCQLYIQGHHILRNQNFSLIKTAALSRQIHPLAFGVEMGQHDPFRSSLLSGLSHLSGGQVPRAFFFVREGAFDNGQICTPDELDQTGADIGVSRVSENPA